GISFDQEGQEEKVREFLKDRELPWTQVYEGKGWDTKLGAQYDVSGIPFVLLVDGDSGQILGTSQELRGEKLSDFIAAKLKETKGGQ
ncbi:MAG: TlpA family protein disulfide reductase, partial [Pirellulaceae bacterium]